jgi:hypothetical protein
VLVGEDEDEEADLVDNEQPGTSGAGVDLNPEDDYLEPADLAGSLTNFGMAQNQDPTLQQARADVQVIDGTPINDGMMPNSFPHFIMKKGLVYRVWI